MVLGGATQNDVRNAPRLFRYGEGSFPFFAFFPAFVPVRLVRVVAQVFFSPDSTSGTGSPLATVIPVPGDIPASARAEPVRAQKKRAVAIHAPAESVLLAFRLIPEPRFDSWLRLLRC